MNSNNLKNCLLTLAGSRAYGISTETSDVDVKGVCLPSKEYFLGFANRLEQIDSNELIKKSFYPHFDASMKEAADHLGIEGSIYEIRKFFKLASDCNPNIWDVLFCKDEHVVYSDVVGDAIREHADLFVSKKARWTFSGYALSELKRIKSHRKWLLDPPLKKPTREDFGLPEEFLLPKERLNIVFSEIQKKIDSWEVDYGDLSHSSKVYIETQIASFLSELSITSDEKFEAAARSIGYSENFIERIKQEREYKLASQHYKQFLFWKENRNPKRAAIEAKHLYDTKNAAHLVRLTRMCKEILSNKGVNIFRPDADQLIAIRNGYWTYEELMEFVEKEEKEINILYENSSLPKTPNIKKIDHLCITLVEQSIKG